MNLNVTIRSPKLAQLAARLSAGKRAELNNAMGLGVRELTRDHLRKLANERHTTAERLGATPTGHLAQAVRAVEGAPVTADAAGATLVINHPGLVRAFHDVTIVPKAAKALTIAVAAIAYGRRAREFSNLFVFTGKTTGNSFLAQRNPEGGMPILLFLLVRSVTQKQDRSLLPSDEQWEKSAARSALGFIQSATGAS